MQFSITAVTFIFIASTGVAAKNHNQLQCTTASGSGQFIFSFPNDAATNKVCPSFCSDCTLGDKDGHRVCNSAGRLMDGDDFSNACLAAGASGSR
ncbi:uncharacterized protein CTRU02_208009 [Colletotrichum truncatum]|uniref:Uncharacterized protein n=1 Tax=Colletotrichum truncatum TaxID=5467 RepID=A0ACC3YV32_COLTU|nr:uncharacterized protein CTRU02_13831 [Colletotrichum truncatum]XP_036579064.1 uncharacterized protein CTRU02_10993 [Colletotrichum truncatum]KAF6782833.1 hypothetical protein CTRU02_13831 [Colletotrichum truncatum]KAF6786495.1 hypothetical protein CTRU02_10993 [Colletotrichum truncatum]